MELIVPLWALITDLILLFAILYATVFFLKRIGRYAEDLDMFNRYGALFLSVAALARLIALLDDFMHLSWTSNATSILSFISILGVIYTIITYVHRLEARYIPTIPKREKPLNTKIDPRAFLFMYDDEDSVKKLLNFIDTPAFIITRSPYLYSSLNGEFNTLWITQSSDRGIPPTKLHVIQDLTVKFLKEAGGGTICVDCLEYLTIYNGFEAVFRFVTSLKDYAMLAGSSIIITLREGTFDERELSFLLREFEPVKVHPKTSS